jgi:hypothetical protein
MAGQEYAALSTVAKRFLHRRKARQGVEIIKAGGGFFISILSLSLGGLAPWAGCWGHLRGKKF